MSTYSAADFIGKTIFITGNVPIYSSAIRLGQKKGKPSMIAKSGDSFIVDSFINKNGTYIKYDDNYWLLQGGGVVSFKDIAGKYDTKAIKDQGVKSDEEKKDNITKVEELVKKYGLYAIGTIIAVVAIKSYILKK